MVLFFSDITLAASSSYDPCDSNGCIGHIFVDKSSIDCVLKLRHDDHDGAVTCSDCDTSRMYCEFCLKTSRGRNALGEKISHCRTHRTMSNGSESAMLSSNCPMRTNPVAAARMV